MVMVMVVLSFWDDEILVFLYKIDWDFLISSGIPTLVLKLFLRIVIVIIITQLWFDFCEI